MEQTFYLLMLVAVSIMLGMIIGYKLGWKDAKGVYTPYLPWHKDDG